MTARQSRGLVLLPELLKVAQRVDLSERWQLYYFVGPKIKDLLSKNEYSANLNE